MRSRERLELRGCAAGERVHFCPPVGRQVGGHGGRGGMIRGSERNGAAVFLRDQWAGNSEYHEHPDPTAMESWARALRKRAA